MVLTKKQNIYFNDMSDICICNNGRKLYLMYAGNLDLYWSISDENIAASDNINRINFIITKENYRVYEQFTYLFENIKNINIFDKEIENEKDKKNYRVFNKSHYNELYKNEIITWYSDETNPVVANYLKIKKDIDCYNICFYTQPYIDGYDYDTQHYNSITVRFRNSGSRYDPFNILFMKMYKELQQIDDIYDEGHQIHIEEIMYEKQKVLSRNKNLL